MFKFSVSVIRKLADRRQANQWVLIPTKTPLKFVNLNGNEILVLITIAVLQALLKGYRGTTKSGPKFLVFFGSILLSAFGFFF